MDHQPGTHILVVDDHRNTRHSLAIGLEDRGFAVDTAATAAEAWLLTERAPYDWVVCDVKMPDVNGFELVQRIRRRWPAIGLVLMTASLLTEADHARALALDAALLVKPVLPATLLDLFARRRSGA